MAADEQRYSGFRDMADTAVGGLDPTEHQGDGDPDAPGAEATPSERSIPPHGTGYTGEDVGATSPGSGTSVSGAGGSPGRGGTMTEGIWATNTPAAETSDRPADDT